MLIVTPNAGEVSSIVAPGSSVPVVGITPSSGASTIVPPSGSVNDPTSSVTPPGGSSSGIVPPGGSVGGSSGGKVKPQDSGYFYNGNGDCVSFTFILNPLATPHCTPSKSLEDEAQARAAKIANGTGTQQDVERLAVIETTLLARARLPDAVADRGIESILKSPFYASLTPGERVQMWLGLTHNFIYNRISTQDFAMMVYGAQNLVVVRNSSGQIIPTMSRDAPTTGNGGDAFASFGAALTNFSPGAAAALTGLGIVFVIGTAGVNDRASLGAQALLRQIATASRNGLNIITEFYVVKAALLILRTAPNSSNQGQISTSSQSQAAAGGPQTPCNKGPGRVPKSGQPNSIYEQISPLTGKVMSRAFYDSAGKVFARQDFAGEAHFIKIIQEYVLPHEHQYEYNSQGQPSGKNVETVLPGDDDIPKC